MLEEVRYAGLLASSSPSEPPSHSRPGAENRSSRRDSIGSRSQPAPIEVREGSGHLSQQRLKPWQGWQAGNRAGSQKARRATGMDGKGGESVGQSSADTPRRPLSPDALLGSLGGELCCFPPCSASVKDHRPLQDRRLLLLSASCSLPTACEPLSLLPFGRAISSTCFTAAPPSNLCPSTPTSS